VTREHIGRPEPGASLGEATAPTPLRFTRWSRVKLDLPDAPEEILDDLFWTSAEKDFQPATYRYLAERGFCGLVWP
jgi:hypothetical protein